MQENFVSPRSRASRRARPAAKGVPPACDGGKGRRPGDAGRPGRDAYHAVCLTVMPRCRENGLRAVAVPAAGVRTALRAACGAQGGGGARAAGDGVQGAKRVNKNLKGRAVEAGPRTWPPPPVRDGHAVDFVAPGTGYAHKAQPDMPPSPSLGKRAIALLPHSIPSHFPHPHGTRQPPRHSRHASARPRPGTPSASKRAQACLTAGKGLRARGRRCARRPSHTERRTGRKVIAFRNNWLEQEQQGLACRGE